MRAQEDPDRALTFLKNLQASKQAELDAKEREMQHSQKLAQKSEELSSYKERTGVSEDVSQKELREAYSAYFKFKELRHELDRSPYDSDLQKELRELGKSIYKNKEAFEVIKNLDPDISKSIQKEALQKKIDHDLDRGRGGLSL